MPKKIELESEHPGLTSRSSLRIYKSRRYDGEGWTYYFGFPVEMLRSFEDVLERRGQWGERIAEIDGYALFLTGISGDEPDVPALRVRLRRMLKPYNQLAASLRSLPSS